MKKSLALFLILSLLITCVPAFASDAQAPMEITYVSWHCGEIEEGNLLEKTLEEKFNVEIKCSRIDLANSEQVNLMLSSGEMPECGWQIGDPYTLYAEQEMTRLIPKDMIKTYAPKYTAFLDEDPIGWNYYYLPDDDGYMGLTGHMMENSRAMLCVRLDWLEKLGLEIPEYTALEEIKLSLPDFYNRVFVTEKQWTADELYEIMKAFTYNDPDGDGQNNTYGVQTDANDNFCWNAYYHMFGMNGNLSYDYTLKNEDGSADVYFATENYRRFLEYWAKAYADGLMDKEYVVLNRESCNEKFANGSAGIMNTMCAFSHTYAMKLAYFNILDRNENAKVLLMPVPTENDGSYAVPNYNISSYNYRFVVRKDVSDEKLAKILEIFDYVNFDEDAQILYRYGEEGVHFNYADPEKKIGYSFTENGHYGKELGIWVFNSNYIQTPISFQVNTQPYASALSAFCDKAYEGHVLQPYKLNLFVNDNTQAYLDAIAMYKASVDTFVSEYRTAIITGEKKLDDTWEEYLNELNDYGYAEIRETLNKLPTFDEYISGNY